MSTPSPADAGTIRPVEEPRLRNPFRSEADAFRLLVIIGLSVLAVVVATLLGGAWLGVPVAVVLVALGARAGYLWLRQALGEEAEPEWDRDR